MSAKKTGGTAGRQRQKNSAMAADLAARKVKRTSCRCPVCYNIVALERVYAHLMSCKGR